MTPARAWMPVAAAFAVRLAAILLAAGMLLWAASIANAAPY